MPLFEYVPGQPFDKCMLPSPQELVLGLNVHLSDYQRSAYDRILIAQAATAEADRTQLLNIRVAGFLLLELCTQGAILGDEPAQFVASELIPLQSPEELSEIGGRYREKLIRAFKTVRTPHPRSSAHPSRPEVDTMEELIIEMMEGSGRDYRTARNRALARDGFRCAITRLFDEVNCRGNRELAERCASEGMGEVQLHCCHILNEGIMQGIDPSSTDDRVVRKNATAGGAMAILKVFGLNDIAKIIMSENGVHDLSNLIILREELSGKFDDLGVWLEATEELNRYRICFSRPGVARTYPNNGFVHFEDHSGRGLPLPSPRLLALHAVCARVAHMSGAAEFFDEYDRDVEETLFMARDGSSAHVLDYALNRHSLVPSVA